MNESNNTASRLEYIDVMIGDKKLRTTRAMADRFIKQMEKQDMRFYNPVAFVQSEQEVGLDNV